MKAIDDRGRRGALCALAVAAALGLGGIAQLAGAQDTATFDEVFAGRDEPLSVPVNKSRVIRASESISRISVGNPGVADIVILRGREVQVVGKALGATNVTLWDRDNRVFASFEVEVVHDLETLKRKLHDLMPDDNIRVYSAQENIVLAGEVASPLRMQSALDLADSFIPECISAESLDEGGGEAVSTLPGAGGDDCDSGKVINMMQVGGAQQVMLKVTVAEMARTVLKRFDANFNIFRLAGDGAGGLVSGGASFPNALTPQDLEVPILGQLDGGTSPIGPSVDKFDPTTPSIENTGLVASLLDDDLFLQAVLDVSRRNGLAKILSEPTLTTLTGQEAEFLSGGEFPIPVPQGGANNSTTIEFKEFGVGVSFVPVVLDSGHINLKLNISVSELSQDNNVAFTADGTTSTFLIPSLTKRSAISTVELRDGQTIGIAGLISDNVREFVDKFPGLGDIPGLGALFRSQEFQSGQTELVIFVTPHLAKPIDATTVRLPTDSFVPPNDLEFYLLGRMESLSGDRSLARAKRSSTKGGPDDGQFGHDL